MILNSLSKSYLPFLSHFRITKPIVNYHDLLELLQTFKKDHQHHKETVNLMGRSSLDSHRPFKKEKMKKNKKDRKSTRLNSSHSGESRMPSSA